MNKRIAVLSMVVFSLGLSVNAMASSIQYDYDRDVNFSTWTLAAWRGDQHEDATMTEKRLEKAVEDGFKARGYTFVEDPAQADFVITYRAGAWQERSIQGVYSGPAFGRSLYVQREQVGRLVINVYERKTGKLAWHGTVTDVLASNPEQADQKTAKAVAKLLKKFPARGGGK